MRSESRDFKYDVFLSHSSKDKAKVRRLAERLRDDGLRVWFDEWEIKAGDDIFLRVECGLQESHTLMLAMSDNAFGSDWVKLERSTVLFRDPANAERRFIPLLIEDCIVPDVIQRYKYVDWREESDAAYAELKEACWPSPAPAAETESAGAPPSEKAAEAPLPSEEELRSLLRADPVWLQGGHTDPVNSVAVLPDGERAISGSWDSTLKLWDISSGKCLATFEGHTGSVRSVAVLP